MPSFHAFDNTDDALSSMLLFAFPVFALELAEDAHATRVLSAQRFSGGGIEAL